MLTLLEGWSTHMSNIEFHWGAMALAALASFIFGFLWYGPFFGRRWGEEMGFDMDADKPAMKEMTWPMLGNLVGNFLIAYTLTWLFAGISDHWSGFLMVLLPSLIIWSGIYLPMAISSKGWEQHTWEFVGINTSFHFLNLLLIGTMITYIHF